MKRKALLIGNTNGLPGVKLDIANWVKFLESDKGGQWCNNEIDIVMNPKKSDILSHIANIKESTPDFVIAVFSGHGAYQRKETILEINENEVIDENDLTKIAPRQISVFDCCRAVPVEILSESQKGVRAFSKGGTFQRNVRPYYEERIMRAMPQQICLYACAIGESAMDTERGGIYTNQLLCFSSSFQEDEGYKLVATAHETAATGTRIAALCSNHTQHPDAIFQPECLPEQQLIIGINPFVNL